MTDTIVRSAHPPGVADTDTKKPWQANGEANPAFFLPGLAKGDSKNKSDSENSSSSSQKPKKKNDSGVSGDSHSEHSDSNNDSNNQKIKESLSKRIKSKEQITQEREKIEKLIKEAGDNITNSINAAINNKNNTNLTNSTILATIGAKRDQKTISIDHTQDPSCAKKIKVENTDESSEENINVDVVGSSDSEHENRHSNAESNDMSTGSTLSNQTTHPGNLNFPGLQQFHSLLANHSLNHNFTNNHLPISTARQRMFAQAEKQRRRQSRKERIKVRLDELMKQVRYLQREYNKTEENSISNNNSSSSTESESADEQAVNLLSSIALPGFEHTALEKLIKKEITNVLVRVREQMTAASFKASGISSNGSTPDRMSPNNSTSSKLSGHSSGNESNKSHKLTAAEELMKAQAAQAAQTIMPQIKKLQEKLKVVPKFNNMSTVTNAGLPNSGISSVTRTLSVQPGVVGAVSKPINLTQNVSFTQNISTPSPQSTTIQLNSIQTSPTQILTPTTPILPTTVSTTPQITPSATPIPQPVPTPTPSQSTSIQQQNTTNLQANQQQQQQTAPANTYAYLKQQQLQQQQQQAALQQQQQQVAAAQQNHQLSQTNVANAAATQAYQQAYQKALLAAKLSQAQAAQESMLGRAPGMINSLPNLAFRDQMASLQEGYAGGYDISDIYGNIHKEGLTPHHLKKAKLMFFYTRYPSSSVLKSYFTDVRFNRATTSQLIKWFSNFREFFYIHIEKIARQGVTEGLASADQIKLTRDHELIRVLNNHYNKSNQFEVPAEFIMVAQKSLKEFFDAIRAGKDQDPSWKKVIYKVICKLDTDIPARFKAPQLAELGD